MLADTFKSGGFINASDRDPLTKDIFKMIFAVLAAQFGFGA